jgi:hypothetical protein
MRINPESKAKSEIKSYDGTAKTANVGSITADIVNNRKNVLEKNAKFIITELEYDGIIGMPTLNNYDIKFKDKSIGLTNNKSGETFELERMNLTICNIESILLRPMESTIISLDEKIGINNCYALVGNSARNQSIPARITDKSIEIFNDSDKYLITDEQNMFICQLELNKSKITDIEHKRIPHYRRTLNMPKLKSESFNINKNLSSTQRQEILNILSEYDSIFARSETDIDPGFRETFMYKINTSTPAQQPAKFVTTASKYDEELQKHIDTLERQKVIEQIEFADVITAGFVIVRKKCGRLRYCLDLRSLNNITIPNKNYPIPHIDEILGKLSGSQYFSSLDLTSAYHQFLIHPDDRDRYTFIGPNKKIYRYRRVPFGGRLITAWLQALMTLKILNGLENSNAYIDDINIGSKNFEQHKIDLKNTLERLSSMNLVLSARKCAFGNTETKAFGYIANAKGYKADPARIKTLQIPMPKTKKELLSTLAGINYYRSTVPKFAELASNLFKLTRTTTEFDPEDPKVQNEWKILIEALGKAIMIQKPDFNRKFILRTDASKKSFGNMLTQKNERGEEIILAVESKQFTDQQIVWSIGMKELQSAAHGVRKYTNLIEGRKFLLITDCKSVFYLLKNRKEVNLTASSPLTRNFLFLMLYDFDILWTKGTKTDFVLTDLLSRNKIDDKTEVIIGKKSQDPLLSIKLLDGNLFDIDTKTEYANKKLEKQLETVNAINLDPVKYFEIESVIKDIKKSQMEDENLRKKIKRISNGKKLETFKTIVEAPYENPILYQFANEKWNLIAPKFLVPKILAKIHRHTSKSFDLSKIVKLGLFWNNMAESITSWHQSCTECSISKPNTVPHGHIEKQIGDFPKRPFDSICIDVIHIRPVMALVSVDHFSGFTSAYVIADEKIETLINATLSLCLRFIVPKMIRLDNHRSFRSSKFIETMNKMDIALSFTTPANSQANGACERRIRQIQERLKTLTINRVIPGKESLSIIDLQTCVDLIAFEINISPRNNKICPLSIMTGIEPSFEIHAPTTIGLSDDPQGQRLSELRDAIQSRIAQEYENEAVSEIIIPHDIKFKIGDIVRIKKVPLPNKSKREQIKYSKETYRVKEILSKYGTVTIVEIKEDDKVDRRRPETRIISIKKLKKVLDRSKLIEEYANNGKTCIKHQKNTNLVNGKPESPKGVGREIARPKEWADKSQEVGQDNSSPKVVGQENNTKSKDPEKRAKKVRFAIDKTDKNESSQKSTSVNPQNRYSLRRRARVDYKET